MRTLLDYYKKPNILIQRRKERLGEYSRWLNTKDKKEKEKLKKYAKEFELFSTTLKAELPELREKTKKLVEYCLYNFAVLTGRWHEFWQRKIMPVLEDEKWRQPFSEYPRHLKEDLQHVDMEVEKITCRNKRLLQGTAEFFALQDGARSSSLTSKPSPGFASPEAAPRGSNSSITSPPMPASTGSSRPSTEGGYQPHGYQQHQRARSRSHGAQTMVRPPLPTVPIPNADGSWLMGQTPPAHTQDASSYEAAGVSTNRYPSQPRPPSNSATPYNRYVQPSANQFAKSTRPAAPYQGRNVFQSALPMPDSPTESKPDHYIHDSNTNKDYKVMFLAASLFDFTIDPTRIESGFPYLTYVPGEIFDVIGTKGELWLAKNQDDSNNTIGWIWEKHFAKLLGEEDHRRMAEEQ